MQEAKSKSILMVGPRLGDPKLAGGMLVNFENLLQDLDELGVAYGVVDTNTQKYKNMLHTFAVVIIDFLKKFRRYDHVHLLATANHLIILGPIFVFMAKLFGKEVSVKKTAGRFHREYRALDPVRKKLVDYTLKNADFVYFETKYIVDYFKHFNKHTYWHPNIRRKPDFQFTPKPYQKRFAFISLVTKEKGMDELLEVSSMLDDSYTIDIYGKVADDKYTTAYFDGFKATYKGALAPEEVQQKIQEYDVIVLPSYEEGYPGILLEAFSYGLPVLTTALHPIKEIVTDGENGFLVPPRDVSALYEGFLRFNQENYQHMAEASYASFDQFDSLKQTTKIVETINSLS